MLALDQRPVLLSAAQVVDRLDDEWRALDPAQIVAEAVEKAIAGSGDAERLREIIDHVTLTRTFVDSVPEKIRYHFAPFGYSDGLPISVAEHLGLSGVTLQYAQAGGQSPQEHVAKLAEAVARGECRAAVLCGGEAIGTMRRHQRSGTNVDWSEETSGDFIDDGIGLDGMFMPYLARHKALAPTDIYPLFEHAKRHQLGEDRVAYRQRLGRLLERFAEVAKDNANSMFTISASADEIGTESAGNRVIADPHLKSMVAKDGVNQAAAVIITSYQQARELGLAERAVFLNGYGIATETDVLNRPDLGSSPALHWAYAQALRAAGASVDDIDAFDLYSCFPVAVIEALAALGLDSKDSRPLTLTGGLPFLEDPVIATRCTLSRRRWNLSRPRSIRRSWWVPWVAICRNMRWVSTRVSPTTSTLPPSSQHSCPVTSWFRLMSLTAALSVSRLLLLNPCLRALGLSLLDAL